MMVHTCNPNTLGGQDRRTAFSPGVRDQPGQHSETLSLQKKKRKNTGLAQVQDQPSQHGETLSVLKIQKLAGRGGTCL